MSVNLNDEHQVPWRASQVDRLLVFRGVQNRARRMRRAGISTDGNSPAFWALRDRNSPKSFDHSVQGRIFGGAQPAARTTSDDPRLPYKTISFS
jgi:hypothetical protein